MNAVRFYLAVLWAVVNEAAILLLKIQETIWECQSMKLRSQASVLPHIHHQSQPLLFRNDLPRLRSVQREENRKNGFMVFLKTLEGEKKKAMEIGICFARIL